MGLSIIRIQSNTQPTSKHPDKHSISFGYHSPLKTYYKKGKFPSVTRDVLGNPLSVKNVSLDHIIPKSQGGPASLENLMLMDKRANNNRGTRPLKEMITVQQLQDYCAQFYDINLPDFKGKVYVRGILKTLGLIK